ncbi:hypothetical protein ICN10_06370 [Polynucleobacter sp. 86C-FISCH]|uniref:hypothetical protein n=1 Tax=Polynucleobacter sp. 86C-FISCH TaxID=2689101 RepID=UPI001C0E62E4|nr:hypothetical protein [Polynucleobacter sp. 86C-FISCH]MBU3596025.1 hypothetical protein [Polynucleobacter sp. 86C-FISCH]
MSEFIKRLQERIKSSVRDSKQALQQGVSNASPKAAHKGFAIPHDVLNPSSFSKALTHLLMLACAISVSFWIMSVLQIPGTPSQPSSGINKGLTLYSNQDASAAYGLFGSKPLATENIYLRGVVATSKNPDGSLDGFAIFEIDGKPTNAISVGETIGKGLSLQSIGDESATLLYEGQKLNFKLNKANKEKSDKSNTSAKK